MPQYTVTKKAFFNGKLYGPNGKRRILTTDEPFAKDKLPSWCEPIKAPAKTVDDLTPAQKAARTKAANKAAKAAADEAPEVDFLDSNKDEPETI